MPDLIAAEAQSAWGCTGTPVLLSHRENAVFAVRFPDGGKAALRVHRTGYKSVDEIEAELEICAALADAGVRCPRGIQTRAGAWLWQGSDGNVVSVVSWIDGHPLGAGDQPLPQNAPALYHALGSSLARMHKAADSLAELSAKRSRWDLNGLTGSDPLWGRYWESPLLTEAEAQTVRQARDAGRASIEMVGPGISFGLIHADALRENVLVTRNGLALIDFDDCGDGYRTYDLATALTQSLDDPIQPELYAALLEGYAAEVTLCAQERALLPVMSMLRSFSALAWVMPRFPDGHPKQALYKARALHAAREVLAGKDFLAAKR